MKPLGNPFHEGLHGRSCRGIIPEFLQKLFMRFRHVLIPDYSRHSEEFLARNPNCHRKYAIELALVDRLLDCAEGTAPGTCVWKMQGSGPTR
jgi:hypothetical protein